MASFKDVLDRCLKQQSSLDFLSSKYDELAKSANKMRESLELSVNGENKRLYERVSMIKSMVVACDSEMENVKQIQQEFAAFKIA